jgi:hypothetical protein
MLVLDGGEQLVLISDSDTLLTAVTALRLAVRLHYSKHFFTKRRLCQSIRHGIVFVVWPRNSTTPTHLCEIESVLTAVY